MPIQQALLHSNPVPEVLSRNDSVDGLCQVDVPGNVWQALQLGSKVFQLGKAALRPLAALVVCLQALGPLTQFWTDCCEAEVTQLKVHFVSRVQRKLLLLLACSVAARAFEHLSQGHLSTCHKLLGDKAALPLIDMHHLREPGSQEQQPGVQWL